ncbi:uncharacterized protein LACBIDRAFT_320671 [Laccaria bicolor S238N-H82]|uniref:Predicted protein n=1 Tax=Laccaria bicolor (strain S238N-H82 / ATCC MYA-4686) TaxID=486041 RepID=B0CQT9_LACBS|nr:uncharacterized protein LACBIDRAFT_320671 [Laccaria bicolor S238N-H82]EDR15091.1 predicted protein [Laccaria bicolor S238N-H82]|eukprot:XP_001873299.1 predicted protein [Laccaria bicolor S238N-H82]
MDQFQWPGIPNSTTVPSTLLFDTTEYEMQYKRALSKLILRRLEGECDVLHVATCCGFGIYVVTFRTFSGLYDITNNINFQIKAVYTHYQLLKVPQPLQRHQLSSSCVMRRHSPSLLVIVGISSLLAPPDKDGFHPNGPLSIIGVVEIQKTNSGVSHTKEIDISGNGTRIII